MKTKNLLSILLLTATLFSKPIFASDLVVEEFGTAPAYPSITLAVAAAVDGDRILIRNRAGNIPWIENVTISKSLELLSYENDTFYIVQGNYIIDAAVGRTVSIIGMKNLSGSIQYGASGGTIKSCTVNVFDSYLLLGNISLGQTVFTVNISGCTLINGLVYMSYGNLIGNSLTNSSSSVEVLTVINNTSFQNDTCRIIGNKITNNTSGYAGMYCSNTSSILHIKNNYIFHRYMGIQINGCANVAIPNCIYNNTIWADNYNFTNYGIYLFQLPTNSITEIMNNVIDASNTGTKYGLLLSSSTGQVNAYYNHIDVGITNSISGSFTFAGNNTTNAGISFNTATAVLNAGDACIDGGNPANPFYDLDLTAGDAGAYGASLSLTNYFPLHSGGARIYSVAYPFNIRSGSTLNVKANGYDR